MLAEVQLASDETSCFSKRPFPVLSRLPSRVPELVAASACSAAGSMSVPMGGELRRHLSTMSSCSSRDGSKNALSTANSHVFSDGWSCSSDKMGGNGSLLMLAARFLCPKGYPHLETSYSYTPGCYKKHWTAG